MSFLLCQGHEVIARDGLEVKEAARITGSLLFKGVLLAPLGYEVLNKLQS